MDELVESGDVRVNLTMVDSCFDGGSSSLLADPRTPIDKSECDDRSDEDYPGASCRKSAHRNCGADNRVRNRRVAIDSTHRRVDLSLLQV